jgi:hypothetical protein
MLEEKKNPRHISGVKTRLKKIHLMPYNLKISAGFFDK